MPMVQSVEPATGPAHSADAAYERCEALTREAARNFWWPISFLPRDRRRAMCALYAFCRGADDIADDDGIADRAGRFAEYRRRLDGAYSGRAEGDVFVALADAVKRFPIRRRDLEEIVEGTEQDLAVTRYRTFADLRAYCHKVASAVGLACVEVFGYRDSEARGHAETLGIAMQLTNIARDVAEDARRGRIYLPAEELAQFRVPESEIVGAAVSDRFRDLMRFQVDRARRLFAESEPLFALLDRRARVCPLALRSLYSKVLGRIEAARYDVFAARASLSKTSKVASLAGAWLRAWTC